MQKSHIFLLVVTLASAGVSAGLWLELRAERALNAQLSERLDAARAVPIARRPVENLSAERPSVISPAAKVATPAPAEPVAAKAERVALEDWQARQRRLMAEPKFLEAWREEQRLQLVTRRENFIRLLGFSPKQADAVIDLLIERQRGWVAHNQSGSMTSEDLQRNKEFMEADERTYQSKVRELLGEEKTAQLQTYMDSRQSRMQVDRFRSQLTGDDMLRDDQVEPLISTLYMEQSQMQKDLQEYRETLASEADTKAAWRKYSEREIEMLKAAHGRMHSAASGILGRSQLDKFDAMLKRDLERHEAQQRMSRIESKLEQSSQPPSGD